jgi:hypothetical protein
MVAMLQPISGLIETTETGGSGLYFLSGQHLHYLGFTAAQSGKLLALAITNDTGFEVGLYTYDHANRTLRRDRILRNHHGTLSPIEWGDGTKLVQSVVAGEVVATLYSENKFQERQFFGGKDIILDADEDSFFRTSVDDVLELYLNNERTFSFNNPAKSYNFYGHDDSATEGPTLRITRTSASPTVNDNGPCIYFQMQDSLGSTLTVFRQRATLLATTAGAVSASVDFGLINAGAFNTMMRMRPLAVQIATGIYLFGAGKTTSNYTSAGWELHPGGKGVFVAQDDVGLDVSRVGGLGPVIRVYQGATLKSSVTLTSGSSPSGATWGSFVGGHFSEWSPGEGGKEWEEPGTVVVIGEGTMPGGNAHLPLVKPSRRAKDQTVWGVVAMRVAPQKEDDDKEPVGSREDGSYLLINGLGAERVKVVGPVNCGQYLETSDIPGVARAQAENMKLNSTVARCVQDVPDDGQVHLARCQLESS